MGHGGQRDWNERPDISSTGFCGIQTSTDYGSSQRTGLSQPIRDRLIWAIQPSRWMWARLLNIRSGQGGAQ